MSRRALPLPILLAVSFAASNAPAPARAQTEGPATVSVPAAIEVRKVPERLRLRIEIISQAKDLEESLAKLAVRKKGAPDVVRGLGAEMSTLKIGEPRVLPPALGGNQPSDPLDPLGVLNPAAATEIYLDVYG
jgi:hypothetical protein